MPEMVIESLSTEDKILELLGIDPARLHCDEEDLEDDVDCGTHIGHSRYRSPRSVPHVPSSKVYENQTGKRHINGNVGHLGRRRGGLPRPIGGTRVSRLVFTDKLQFKPSLRRNYSLLQDKAVNHVKRTTKIT